MSVKVMARVWDSDLPPNLRLVLLAYADAAEHDGTQSFPGEARVSQMTGYSVSQVRRITKELIDAGVLVQVKRGYRGQRAEFAVTVKASQIAPLSVGESLASEAEKPSAHATPPVLTRKTSLRSVPPDEESTNQIGVWTALEERFGEVTTRTGRSGRAKVARSLVGAGATYSEVHRRAKAWPKLFPASNGGKPATLTDFALEKHWGQLGLLVAENPEWSPESCRHPAAADVNGDGGLWCPACEREVAS